MTAFQFALAYVLELVLGDPKWFPHPVRGIGFLIQWLEEMSRRVSTSPSWEKGAGLFLAIGLPTAIFLSSLFIIIWIGRYGSPVQSLLIVILAYSTLATRSLHQEAFRIVETLKGGRVSEARKMLSRLAGRDTEHLTYPEILKEVLETLSENLSEEIIAPLFYLLLGGVPLAMAYKTVSTLDSLVGYNNTRYNHFGWASSGLDDLVNYIPARMTAMLICLLSFPLGFSGRQAWQFFRQDGRKVESPNAGLPQAALAGALQIQLGGPIDYKGVRTEKPFLGEDRSEITLTEYKKTVIILYGSSLIMALVVFGLRLIWDWNTK